MKYTVGKVGRVLVAHVEHGDDLLEELKNIARQEKLEAAIFYVIGALREATLVAGPEACSQPPVPVWRGFDDCREVVGVGTLFWDDDEPALHLHATLGRGDTVLMGCLRNLAQVYLVAEVILLELTGTGAMRSFNPLAGLTMLDFKES